MSLPHTIQCLFSCECYTEGPCIDSDGNIYATTLTGGQVLRYTPDGQVSVWAEALCPNGQLILPGNDHLVCDSQQACILQFNSQGKCTGRLFESGVGNKKISTPNDLITDRSGSLFFTDSVRHSGAVFCSPANGPAHCIADNLDYPNGLAFSPDEETLYVAESYRNRVACFSRRQQWALTKYILLPAHVSGKIIDNLPDGLAVNSLGILAIAHYGMEAVQLYSPRGERLGFLPTGLRCTSNVYFISDNHLLVSGGHNEPGPGAIHSIQFSIQ